MPAVAQFPTPVEFGGPGGPFWSDFHYEGPKFKVLVGPEYGDGSRDRNVEATAGVHRWTLEYETSVEDLAVLDAHYNSAFGPGYGFNFYDHRQGALFTSCHYEEYKRSKGKGKNAGRGKRRLVIVCEPS